MKFIHIKYGQGIILEDLESLCKDGEVIFKPDKGIFDKIEYNASTDKALWNLCAISDIVNKKDLIPLNN